MLLTCVATQFDVDCTNEQENACSTKNCIYSPLLTICKEPEMEKFLFSCLLKNEKTFYQNITKSMGSSTLEVLHYVTVIMLFTLPAAGAARRQLNDGTHDGWYHVPITSPGHVLSISKSFLERFFQKSIFLVCSLWL